MDNREIGTLRFAMGTLQETNEALKDENEKLEKEVLVIEEQRKRDKWKFKKSINMVTQTLNDVIEENMNKDNQLQIKYNTMKGLLDRIAKLEEQKLAEATYLLLLKIFIKKLLLGIKNLFKGKKGKTLI